VQRPNCTQITAVVGRPCRATAKKCRVDALRQADEIRQEIIDERDRLKLCQRSSLGIAHDIRVWRRDHAFDGKPELAEVPKSRLFVDRIQSGHANKLVTCIVQGLGRFDRARHLRNGRPEGLIELTPKEVETVTSQSLDLPTTSRPIGL
jgi:hypothetical protein